MQPFFQRGSASKPYTPKPGSGGYAILLALYNNRDKKFMNKKDLCKAAQPFCNVSMTWAPAG